MRVNWRFLFIPLSRFSIPSIDLPRSKYCISKTTYTVIQLCINLWDRWRNKLPQSKTYYSPYRRHRDESPPKTFARTFKVIARKVFRIGFRVLQSDPEKVREICLREDLLVKCKLKPFIEKLQKTVNTQRAVWTLHQWWILNNYWIWLCWLTEGSQPIRRQILSTMHSKQQINGGTLFKRKTEVKRRSPTGVKPMTIFFTRPVSLKSFPNPFVFAFSFTPSFTLFEGYFHVSLNLEKF